MNIFVAQLFTVVGWLNPIVTCHEFAAVPFVPAATGGNGGTGTNGTTTRTGAIGGYSMGFYTPVSATTLYVYPGGVGTAGATTTTTARAGGANGGGSATSTSTTSGGGAGGGASHVALMTGTLANIGVANLNQILLIVAGGGGGAAATANGSGTGGGLVGAGSSPGTQTSGNAFGQGANSSTSNASGGGGGLWGGGTSTGTNNGGGSGYISGVDYGYTQQGQSGSMTFTNGLIGNCFGQFGRYTFSEKGVIPIMEFGTRGSTTQMNLSTTFSVANTFENINTINGIIESAWRITMIFNQPTAANNWNVNCFKGAYLPYITVFVNHADASAVGVDNSWRGLIFGTVTIMPPM